MPFPNQQIAILVFMNFQFSQTSHFLRINPGYAYLRSKPYTASTANRRGQLDMKPCAGGKLARTPTVASLHREETCNRHAKERFSGPTATDQCSTRFWTFVSWHCDGGGVWQLGKPLRRGHPSLFERAARCMLPGRRS
jgi:hypothetical protein